MEKSLSISMFWNHQVKHLCFKNVCTLLINYKAQLQTNYHLLIFIFVFKIHKAHTYTHKYLHLPHRRYSIMEFPRHFQLKRVERILKAENNRIIRWWKQKRARSPSMNTHTDTHSWWQHINNEQQRKIFNGLEKKWESIFFKWLARILWAFLKANYFVIVLRRAQPNYKFNFIKKWRNMGREQRWIKSVCEREREREREKAARISMQMQGTTTTPSAQKII